MVVTLGILRIFFVIILCICACSVIGGYILGKTIGGNKLTKISPNKTISGSLGSFIFSIFTLFLFNLQNYVNFNFSLKNILFCLFICMSFQLVDLIISYFKRLNKISRYNLLFEDFLGNFLLSWSKASENNKKDSFKFLDKIPGRYNNLKQIQNSFLQCYFDDAQTTKSFEKLIIATTTLPEDDKIVQFCTDNNVNYFRGDSKNVLERHYRCAEKFSLSTIIRMPSDKPLLDPEVVDKAVKIFNENSYDYVTNFLPSTFPGGTEVEVLSFASLKKSWERAILPSEKEHVTNYIYNHRDDFSIFNMVNSENLSNFRWAVNRIEDLRLVRTIVSRIPKSPILITDILELFKNDPSLIEINKQVD